MSSQTGYVPSAAIKSVLERYTKKKLDEKGESFDSRLQLFQKLVLSLRMNETAFANNKMKLEEQLKPFQKQSEDVAKLTKQAEDGGCAGNPQVQILTLQFKLATTVQVLELTNNKKVNIFMAGLNAQMITEVTALIMNEMAGKYTDEQLKPLSVLVDTIDISQCLIE